ncbi:hypothetical protein O3P69_015274 [Scylla paramamosain]|uniref:Uncharacterized protein n=1 Tax=Scylla paramamosain TaxID=85552 RepID=A0AAW0T3T2_SCYPA
MAWPERSLVDPHCLNTAPTPGNGLVTSISPPHKSPFKLFFNLGNKGRAMSRGSQELEALGPCHNTALPMAHQKIQLHHCKHFGFPPVPKV